MSKFKMLVAVLVAALVTGCAASGGAFVGTGAEDGGDVFPTPHPNMLIDD